MPIGPRGEKRPKNPNAAAVMVGRIATGRAQEEYEGEKPASKNEQVIAMQIADPEQDKGKTETES